jgi:rare lipoprotein A
VVLLFKALIIVATLLVSSSAFAACGLTSFYGGKHNGYGRHTTAHKTLPFGTKLHLTHGKKSCSVIVNDRGPFIRGRVLDVSLPAARCLGFVSKGVAKVCW